MFHGLFCRCTDVRTGAEVNDAYCDWTEQPADFSACHTACPGDCVLGPWSEWSPCSKVTVYFTKINNDTTFKVILCGLVATKWRYDAICVFDQL